MGNTVVSVSTCLPRASNLEEANLSLEQKVGDLQRALGEEAAGYQAQVTACLWLTVAQPS